MPTHPKAGPSVKRAATALIFRFVPQNSSESNPPEILYEKILNAD